MSEGRTFYRRVEAMLLFVVLAALLILGFGIYTIYDKVDKSLTQATDAVVQITIVQRQIADAIQAGPEATTKALCRIFETFDRLSIYHGFPPATDAETRRVCKELLGG